jgi:hypothetical protein
MRPTRRSRFRRADGGRGAVEDAHRRAHVEDRARALSTLQPQLAEEGRGGPTKRPGFFTSHLVSSQAETLSG